MGENLRGFSLVPEVSGALNLCAVVWTLFYRWQECLYGGRTYGVAAARRSVFD